TDEYAVAAGTHYWLHRRHRSPSTLTIGESAVLPERRGALIWRPTMDIPTRAPLADNTAPKQRGRPFRAGQSGNPNGRPKGSRNKTTVLVEALLDAESEAITRKLLEKALDGDMAAMRLCVERLLPLRRDRPVAFELPSIANAADAQKAS